MNTGVEPCQELIKTPSDLSTDSEGMYTRVNNVIQYETTNWGLLLISYYLILSTADASPGVPYRVWVVETSGVRFLREKGEEGLNFE